MAVISHRIRQLDILRFCAIFLVLGRHLQPAPEYVIPAISQTAAFWKKGGWIGVDLFFVLSGFLVSGLIFREYQKSLSVDIKRFLIRRGFKIYPAFWVMILVTVVVRLWTGAEIPVSGLLGELFFLQNYVGLLWGQTWSLAVEEHFYFLLALLIAFLIRRFPADPFGRIPRIFVGVAIICFLLRLLATTNSFYGYYTHLYPTQLRLDSLFFGVLISYCWNFEGLAENTFLRIHRRKLGLIGTILLLPAFVFELESTPWMTSIGLTIFYFGSGALLVSFILSKLEDRAGWRLLGYIGQYSYSIYLWHMAVETWGTSVLRRLVPEENWYVYAAFYLTLSIGFGIFMGKLIEAPFLKLRDKFFPPVSRIRDTSVG